MLKILVLLSSLFFLGCGNNMPNQEEETSADLIDYESLKEQLETIYDVDQVPREKMSKMYEESKTFDPALMKEMVISDSINLVKVLAILENYGWLPMSKIGEKASDALFLVIQHSDAETMEKYLPELKKQATKNEAKKSDAAMMEDRVLTNNHKKQLYGTQALSRQKKDGSQEFFIWPIEHPESVNERRAEAGFELTVEENAKRLNAIYNPKEEMPEK